MKDDYDFGDKAIKCLLGSGRASFELSGYTTTKRQWENIVRFANLLHKTSR